jgi:hypothetical protein
VCFGSKKTINEKTRFEEGEVLVVCDFAENYSFVVQDEYKPSTGTMKWPQCIL